MGVKSLSDYGDFLSGCRFCLMCKPAADVANVTLIESYTTRARGMMLWRIINEFSDFTPRDAELLYQSTLDSISQAWCVNHYPVSEYVVAARAEVHRKGLVPEPVRNALKRSAPEPAPVKSDVILLASEAAEIGAEDILQPALRILKEIGRDAEPLLIRSGSLAYCLGAVKQAAEQAMQVIDLIKKSGVKSVIADGPVTLWAIKYIYPILDVSWPEDIAVTSIPDELLCLVKNGGIKKSLNYKQKIIFHDARSACLLAGEMATDQAIQPGFSGPEEALGRGEIYDDPRSIVDAFGIERCFSVWSRALSKSCGADDGLWITYPELARELAEQRLREAEKLGAGIIVTDSLLCAGHLKNIRQNHDAVIRWLPELLEQSI